MRSPASWGSRFLLIAALALAMPASAQIRPGTNGAASSGGGGGSGTVTHVTCGSGLSGNVITTTGTCFVPGGAITNAMLAGSIDLTTKVTGTLPVGNGGSGAASFTANAFLTGGGSSAFNAVAITGLVLGAGASAPGAYAGTSCTNQFPRSLNASGAATCASVANADLSNSSITIAGHAVSLGGSQAIACADLSNGATGCSTATGTSGATIPLLNGTNTFSGAQTFGEVIGTVSTQAGTTYTLAATDCGTAINFTSGTAVTLTTLSTLPVGCHIVARQGGAGQVTVADGAGATHVSASSYTKTRAQYSKIGLSVIVTTVFDIDGDGA